MGNMRDKQIADSQARNGIEPAASDRRVALSNLSMKAYEIIRLVELEKSGIRDGDGCWSGCDPLEHAVSDLACIYSSLQSGDTLRREVADFAAYSVGSTAPEGDWDPSVDAVRNEVLTDDATYDFYREQFMRSQKRNKVRGVTECPPDEGSPF